MLISQNTSKQISKLLNGKKKALFLMFCCLNSLLLAEPTFFYHGSPTDGIDCLEPRIGHIPGNETNSPPSVYASDLPAFAAAQSFSWSTDEGIDLYVDNETVVLEIPASISSRLQSQAYIYSVDSQQFSRVESETTGHTFRSTGQVPCLQKESFQNVVEAIEYYGGKVIVKE